MIEVPFAALEGDGGVQQNSRESLVNMYAEPAASGKKRLIRRQRPGLTLLEAKTGLKRGVFKFSHGHYAVIRDEFYSYDGTTLTLRGVLDTSTGNVTMVTDDNGDVAVSDGATLYHWDSSTNTFSKPTTQSTVGTLGFVGGYAYYHQPNTDTIWYSALNDMTSWGALDFFRAESESDRMVRVFVDNGELILMGNQTTEIWRPIANVDIPVGQNAVMKRGCLAPYSVASDDNTTFWLADDKIVYRMDGYRPARISTHEIEDWIEGASDAATAKALIYTYRGSKFYTLTIPGYGTKQYNIATGFWNAAKTLEQDDWDLVGGAGNAVDYYLNASGFVVLSGAVNKDISMLMERIGISAPVHADERRMKFRKFQLDCEVGTVAEGTSEPEVSLSVSRNGETFGTERLRGLGATGDYLREVVWRNLGESKQFTLKFSVTDDVNFAVIGAYADIAA